MTTYEWSARAQPRGGPVTMVRSTPGMPAVSRVAVLVHGYNNDAASAAEAYATFSAHLERVHALAWWPAARFFWPGDTPWAAIGALSYPSEIGTAKLAARELAAFLATLRGPDNAPVEIAFVTHSLGGRLLLEVLTLLIDAPHAPVVSLACLMGAAVPVDRVARGGVLRAAAEISRRSAVFHSEHDVVLRWAFRLGQLAAGEGFGARAVGRFGEPRRGLWAVSMPTRHGHGEYWTARDCAEEVARQLGAAPPRRIAARALPRHTRAG